MTIDVHGHCTPRAYIDALLARREFPRAHPDGDGYRVEVSEQAAFRATPLHWDLSLRVPALDAAGVERQVLSLSSAFGFELLHGAEAVDTADAVNEALREAAAAYGTRFLPLAVAPIEPSDEALAALKRALAGGCRGMILSASVVAHLPADEVLLPFLRALEEANGWMLVHPGARVNVTGLPPRFPLALSAAGFQNELTVALFRLLFGGLLDAVPGLRVVFVNLGGAAPLLAERLQSLWEGRRQPGEAPPHAAFRRVWYDYSSFREHGLRAAVAVLGADRLLLGTDYPIQPLDRPLQALAAAELDPAVQAAIQRENAQRVVDG